MRTFCRFGLKRRRVATIEWLREFPNAGPLPQLKQTLAMARHAIELSGTPDGRVRAVTHLDVTRADVDETLKIASGVLLP